MHGSTANLKRDCIKKKISILRNNFQTSPKGFVSLWFHILCNVLQLISEHTGVHQWAVCLEFEGTKLHFFPPFSPLLPPLTVTHKAIHSKAVLIQPQSSPEVPRSPPYCPELTWNWKSKWDSLHLSYCRQTSADLPLTSCSPDRLMMKSMRTFIMMEAFFLVLLISFMQEEEVGKKNA